MDLSKRLTTADLSQAASFVSEAVKYVRALSGPAASRFRTTTRFAADELVEAIHLADQSLSREPFDGAMASRAIVLFSETAGAFHACVQAEQSDPSLSLRISTFAFQALQALWKAEDELGLVNYRFSNLSRGLFVQDPKRLVVLANGSPEQASLTLADLCRSNLDGDWGILLEKNADGDRCVIEMSSGADANILAGILSLAR